MNKQLLIQCPHRITHGHVSYIKKVAKKRGIKQAEAMRAIIDEHQNQ